MKTNKTPIPKKAPTPSPLERIKPYALKAAIGLAIFTPLYFGLAALGTKLNLWGWKFGFGKLTFGWGAKLLLLTLAVTLIALILSVWVKPRKHSLVALICLAVPLIGLGLAKNLRHTAKKLPPIHDITTSTQNPPTFSQAIIKQRGKCSNSLKYIGSTYGKKKTLVAEAQVKHYPDIRTIVVSQEPDFVFDRAALVVAQMGWTLASSTKDTGVIEATERSFWYGFTDDVVIRIRPADGGGSLMDVRSVSCHGVSDLGKNAARIRKFRKAFNKK